MIHFSMRNHKDEDSLQITVLPNDGQISAGNRCIENVTSIKYLGVVLDQNLTFKPHVEYLSGRVRRYMIKKARITSDLFLVAVVLYCLLKLNLQMWVTTHQYGILIDIPPSYLETGTCMLLQVFTEQSLVKLQQATLVFRKLESAKPSSSADWSAD
ncbi:unnamed protein product [Leptidea sinapis]|uniref:Uncharacterized protein n=1 Tax=Leptidea sinapis TaxID=189913 RepID=A0A5E4PWF9_9NEOP|nr:unnamed protein product [Leptidea sinapis]